MEIDTFYAVLGIIALGVFGAIFGSFAACQVRRMHTRSAPSSPHSICLHCRHRLRWYDNIPIFSWLTLRGRCRYCHAPIGRLEIFSEIGLALVFILIGISFFTWFDITAAYGQTSSWLIPGYIAGWPTLYRIVLFLVLLATIVGLWILLLYDAKWQRLPVKVLTFCIICAIIYRLGCLTPYFFIGETASWALRHLLLSLGGAIVILPGTYFILYKLSHERWVGGGDWLLCLALAFLLGSWRLALIELFLANFLGSVIMLPAMRFSQHRLNHQIPFGPFLITGFFITFACQEWLLANIIPISLATI